MLCRVWIGGLHVHGSAEGRLDSVSVAGRAKRESVEKRGEAIEPVRVDRLRILTVMSRLLSRSDFAAAVLKRDGYRCVVCREPADKAHPLIDSGLWPDGGYYLENGVSVCAVCRVAAEKTFVSPEELREKAGIKTVLLPEHFDAALKYDRRGNVIVNKTRRSPGELFYEPNVQEVLGEAGLLGLFDGRVKYPRTMHFDWSENLQNDDRRLLTEKYFEGEEIIVTEKLDGENTTMTRDYIHARSLDSKDHPSRGWVKQLHGRIRREIPEDWRICGENMYAVHSIAYEALRSYFYVFNIWERGECLSWDETVEFSEVLGLKTVAVLYQGPWDRRKLIELAASIDRGQCEGYVARVARRFRAHEFSRVVGKFVRAGHVQTSEHWMSGPVVPNRLADGEG